MLLSRTVESPLAQTLRASISFLFRQQLVPIYSSVTVIFV
jgi:hypothetical protein